MTRRSSFASAVLRSTRPRERLPSVSPLRLPKCSNGKIATYTNESGLDVVALHANVNFALGSQLLARSIALFEMESLWSDPVAGQWLLAGFTILTGPCEGVTTASGKFCERNDAARESFGDFRFRSHHGCARCRIPWQSGGLSSLPTGRCKHRTRPLPLASSATSTKFIRRARSRAE